MVMIPVGSEGTELSGAEKSAKLAGKTYDKFDGLDVQFAPGDQPGSEAYVAKVKAALQAKAGADEIGHDTNQDGTYAGKSLELGKGGRSELLQDRITLELVQKGRSLEDATRIAKAQSYKYGVKKYGAQQMEDWGKAAAK